MKKVFLCAVLIVGIAAIGFSQQEMWFTAGAAFGNYFVNSSEQGNSYTGSPGINLSLYYLFGQKSVGLFFNYGILFPVINNSGNDYEPSVQLDFHLLGVGFGHDINEKIKLYYGIGPNLANLTLSTSTENNEKRTNSIMGIGLGGDIGIILKHKNFCFNIGTTLAWNFAVFNEVSKEIDGNDGWRHIKIEQTGWGNINPIIGIKPYITFGYYFNTKKE